MRWRNIILVLGTVVIVTGLLPFRASALFGGKDQATIVAETISAISKIIALRPSTAIDLSGTSGEYCLQVNLNKGGHMSHYAADPQKTREDVIDFVNATQFMEAGLDVKKLPKFPGKLGSMEPNRWYYLAPGEFEPHHGRKFSFPILIRAVDIG